MAEGDEVKNMQVLIGVGDLKRFGEQSWAHYVSVVFLFAPVTSTTPTRPEDIMAEIVKGYVTAESKGVLIDLQEKK